MHELGIAQDLFQIVKERAEENNLKKVTKIKICLGVASGIEKGFLEHSFIDHIFPKSIAEGAMLEIIHEPMETHCKDCGKELNTDEKFTLTCPACGSFNIEITKGKEVYIETIEGDT